ncbi:AraC family transcriptional regulator [Mycobacterium sp.]|uniref:AraC family transcriptional regulator n=1 Tax=Mycobacterium sp. TaxID=1785 RepID=UPI003A86AA58
MHLIRGSSLTGFAPLVTRLGGNPDALLTLAGIDPADAGRHDRYVLLRNAIAVVEEAAAVLSVDDFGRQLARYQSIDILGAVGLAARTAATVAEAFTIIDTHMPAYSSGSAARIRPCPDPTRCRFEYDLLLDPPPPQAQAIELALGLTLRALRLFLGTTYRPIAVHLPHPPLGTKTTYRTYFGASPHFTEPFAGFTLRTADLQRPLNHDPLAHQLALTHLTDHHRQHAQPIASTVGSIIRQLLPTGEMTAELVARQFGIHRKTLQRRLVSEGTSFAELADRARRELAHRLLEGTDLPVSQVTRQLGYAEHSVFTRACKRWFGVTPTEYRNTPTAEPTD